MSKISLDKIPFEKVKSDWLVYDSAAKSYFKNMAIDIDYYHGNQLNALQVDWLDDKNLPLSNPTNIIKQVVDSVVASVAAGSPELAATVNPETSFNTDPARIFTAIFKDITHKSKFDIKFREQTADFVRKGLGITTIYPVKHPEPGLLIDRLEPESLRVPEKTKKADFQDAENIVRHEFMTRNHAKTVFLDHQKAIDDAPSENESTGEYHYGSETVSSQGVRDGRGENVSLETETISIWWNYAKVPVRIYRVKDITGRMSPAMAKDMADRVLASMKEAGVEGVSIDKGWNVRVRETVYIGVKEVSDEILPISKYPFGIACNNHSGNPFPASDIRYARGAQDTLNRVIGIIMDSAENAINGKAMFERGALDDDAVDALTEPKLPVVVEDGALSGGIDGRNKRIEFIPQGQMMANLFNEREKHMREIKSSFSAWGAGIGDPTDFPETASGAMILEENVSRNQRNKVRPLYDSTETIGDVALEWIPFVYTTQQVFEISDEERIVVNRPQFDELTNRLTFLNDLQSLSGHVRAIVDSARAKNSGIELQMALLLVQNKLLTAKEFIRVNLPQGYDKKMVALELNQISALEGQVQALSEQLKQITGDLQTAQRGHVNAEMKSAINDATKQIEIAASKAVTQITAQTGSSG